MVSFLCCVVDNYYESGLCAFRIWGWKTKISCHTAVLRDRVRDNDVFDDALDHVVLQQNVSEVGACSVRRANVPQGVFGVDVI